MNKKRFSFSNYSHINIILLAVTILSLIVAASSVFILIKTLNEPHESTTAMWSPMESIDKELLRVSALEKSLQKTLLELDNVVNSGVDIGKDFLSGETTIFVILESSDVEKTNKQIENVKKLISNSVEGGIPANQIYIHVNRDI